MYELKKVIENSNFPNKDELLKDADKLIEIAEKGD